MTDSWQPIETAPKDGTELLLFDDGEWWLGYWKEVNGNFDWYESGTYSPFRPEECIFLNPSHWKPLSVPEGTNDKA